MILKSFYEKLSSRKLWTVMYNDKKQELQFYFIFAKFEDLLFYEIPLVICWVYTILLSILQYFDYFDFNLIILHSSIWMCHLLG